MWVIKIQTSIMTPSMPILIDPFYSNRLLSFKINVFSRVVGFIHSVKGKLTFSLLYSIISSINKDLGKTLIMIEGLNAHITKQGNQKFPEEDYITFMSLMKKYRSYYHLMEKVNFFDLDTTKELANTILMELYEIEFKIRANVFQDKTSEGYDKDLIDYASKISLHSALQITK